jgi:predicted GNAT family acetyltransferase
MEAEMTEESAIQISYEDKGQRGRFVARINGVAVAGELTISRVSDVLIIADGTFVSEPLRGTGTGTGTALALVQAMVTNARVKAYRIVPLCPYVRAQSLKHPEWSDVIQN